MDRFLEELSKPLTADQIDFRIQSINKGGYATILAYKDARVDMHRLNEVFGVGKWQRKHELINGQLFCSVGVFVDNQWAWVQDVGTPSNTEAAKGQASDSFKRACFNLGIGIELYDYPVIQVKLNANEFECVGEKVRQTWNLKLREWSWFTQFKDGKLKCVAAKDEKGKIRFKWGEYEKERTPYDAFMDNHASILAIREAFEAEDYPLVVQLWDEITGDPEGDVNSGQNDKTLLWIAPTKYKEYGLPEPIFSTELRAWLKDNASKYR